MFSTSEQPSPEHKDPCHISDVCDKIQEEKIPIICNTGRYRDSKNYNDYQFEDVECENRYHNGSREWYEKNNHKKESQDCSNSKDIKDSRKDRSRSRERDYSSSKRRQESKSVKPEGRDSWNEHKEDNIRHDTTKECEWDRKENIGSRRDNNDWKREVGWDKHKYDKRLYESDRNKHGRDKEHQEESNKRRSKERGESEYNKSDAEHLSKLNREGADAKTTIVIRYLTQDITEDDIRLEILSSGFVPDDVRLIKRRDTGESRGFAFVNFSSAEEACRWMREKQGEMTLKNGYKALMHFSVCRDPQIDRNWQDWHCIKCGTMNFKRRDSCFRCHSTRQNCEDLGGSAEVSYLPTSTVLLRGLDVLSTENSVLQAINTISSVPIKSIHIAQDPLTNMSRGVCYLEMNHITDAICMYSNLITNPPVVDGRKVLISYRKIITPQIRTEIDSMQKQSVTELKHYTLEDIPHLADYSASLYASSTAEYAVYQQYYQQYYQAQILQGSAPTQTDSVNVAAAVAQSAIQQLQATKYINVPMKPAEEVMKFPNVQNTGSRPDVCRYQYDETSGYYYDPQTGLYYDAGSNYYYNPQTRQYLYWNSCKESYLPAPVVIEEPSVSKDEEKKDKLKDKEDKVKVAKKIAKDMKRWAKTLNQKKDSTRQNVAMASVTAASSKCAGAVDAGYTILERKDYHITDQFMRTPTSPQPTTSRGLVPAYGSSSNSEEEIEDIVQEGQRHTNWEKLACLLCKRQFSTKESLTRHQQLSDLHKLNLQIWYSVRGLDPNDPQQRNKKYRDRARERRRKFNETESPCTNTLKEKYLKTKEKMISISYEEPTKAGIGSDNVGNRLLQKMGWKEGMGLGKTNQGSTSIVKVEGRCSTTGLGAEATYAAVPGDTYKDCVKKLMFARYQELSQKESERQCMC